MSVENKIDRLLEEGLLNWAKNNPGLAAAGLSTAGIIGTGLYDVNNHIEKDLDLYTKDAENTVNDAEHMIKTAKNDYDNGAEYYSTNGLKKPLELNDVISAEEKNKQLALKELNNLNNYRHSADRALDTVQTLPEELKRNFGFGETASNKDISTVQKGLATVGTAGLGKALYDRIGRKRNKN